MGLNLIQPHKIIKFQKNLQKDYSAMNPAFILNTEIPTFWIITAI